MSMTLGTEAPEENRAIQFYWIMTALAIEISFSGLMSIASRFLQGYFQSVYQVTTIMVAFNIACIAYCVTGLLVWNSVESNCPAFLLAANILSHVFYTSFYCFMIAKTLVISDMDPWVAYASIAILLNRICWAAADIALSPGIWSDGRCTFVQHPVTGVAYNVSDLLTDLFCTVVSITWNWNILKSDFSGMMRVIVKENILRSAVIFAINSYNVYINFTATEMWTFLVAFSIQNYAYTRLLNAEFLWSAERKRADDKMRLGASIRSTNTH